MVADLRDFPWGAGAMLLFTTLSAAVLGGLVSGGRGNTWYDALEKPALTPPDLVFGLVWPLLFILMAAGALIVLYEAGSYYLANSPLGIYYTMLGLNVAWSYAFFGFHDVPLAMGVLTALWLSIVAMMQDFWRYSHRAALLQIPYLVWVTFAGYLNLSIMLANSGG